MSRVVPVVQRGPEDDHRLAARLLGVVGEFARHGDDLLARHAADRLGPGGRIGRHGVVVAPQPRHAVIGQEQVVDGRDLRRAAIGQRDGGEGHACVTVSPSLVGLKNATRAVAEIGEGDPGAVAPPASDRRGVTSSPVRAVAALEVPLALLAPAEADRPGRHIEPRRSRRSPRRSSSRGCSPRRASPARSPARSCRSGDQAAVLLGQHHQHRHVGIAAAVVEEVVAACPSRATRVRITWPIAMASAASVPCFGCSHRSANFDASE